MKSKFKIALCVCVALFFLNSSLLSSTVFAETVAVAFFYNKSDAAALNYLKEVLPTTIATSLDKKYYINSIKPAKLDFLKKYTESPDYILPKDLQPMSLELRADYLIFGSFEPLPQGKIRVITNLYKCNSNGVFTFLEEGELGTDIFTLVDKIAYRINNLISDREYYKNGVVPSKSRISIITNIEGEELNICYNEFLKGGFRIFSSVGNELETYIDDTMINYFHTFYTPIASYEKISFRSEIFLAHGTWSGTEYYKKILKERDIYNKYAFDYDKTSLEYINKIRKNDLFDYSLVISFNKDSNSAWVRCIGIKDFKLIYSEKNISGSDIAEITKKIIAELSAPMPEKF